LSASLNPFFHTPVESFKVEIIGVGSGLMFANEHDLRSGLCTLLMSDIIGNTADQVASCSPAKAKVAAFEIARLHAAGQSKDLQKLLPWLRSVNDPVMVNAKTEQLKLNIPIVIKVR
jgi:hypothetical protein